MSTRTLVKVTIEGKEYELEDRSYSGRELRKLAGLAPRDKLVREEEDASETAIPPGKQIRLRAGDNLFVSVRFRRG
jgi:hypothetical protein